MRSSLLIAKYTILDYLKSRSMLAIFMISLFLFLITFIASQVTYKTVDKVIIDVGLGLTGFFVFLSSIYWGQVLLSDEIKNRTVHTILSRGTSRLEFFLGKLISVSVIIAINLFVLEVFVIALFWAFGGEINMMLFHVFWGLYLISLLLSSIATLLSFLMNGYLSFILTLSIFVSSSVISSTLNTRFVKLNSSFENFLIVLKTIVPDFNKLNFTDYVMSVEVPSNFSLLKVFFYGVGFILLINFCSYYLVFNKKELS